MINVEVVYANAKKQAVLSVSLAEQATVQAAIEQSGILQQYPEINLNENKVGIYSELVTLDTQLSDGDRVEIYRPLNITPMEARRLRAKKNKN